MTVPKDNPSAGSTAGMTAKRARHHWQKQDRARASHVGDSLSVAGSGVVVEPEEQGDEGDPHHTRLGEG